MLYLKGVESEKISSQEMISKVVRLVEEKAEEIISIMESAVELKVPNKVDYEQGENWGDIK